ncbi:SNF2 helicase associated domain-containing protein [Rhodococcus pseudokoreensis]|uniref:SNF2 helicase associated domain-containing protein n=1 Tax=Rhodococcus pseudokoreensis TaxID=2811421 RepID=A0A974WAT9_9NOCA|nr:SNF2-related protein [Rhodococcus pseudokoreensis]QSE93937.1 SNF2 helicase associated domain-containing protein [Rhodococcus pseudokoreensis]
MLPPEFRDVDVASIRAVLGTTTFTRGAQYAQTGAVSVVAWDPAAKVLWGEVMGTATKPYAATAFVTSTAGRTVYRYGLCTCPVAMNCKHVAAVLITAMNKARSEAPDAVAPTWDRSLSSLLTPLDAFGESARRTPLAIQFRVSASAVESGPQLLVRPVQPGSKDWIVGGLAWNKLGSSSQHPAEHIRVLHEIHLLADGGMRYRRDNNVDLNLSIFPSRQLWSLLDEAARVGVQLIHTSKRLGALAPVRSAEICLDATHDEAVGALVVQPVVRVDGERVDATTVGFIGLRGHGLFYVDADERIQLARLDSPVHAALQDLVRRRTRIEIPDDERSRFLTDFLPKLRNLATVISSDGSFVPPAISAPTLTLRARYLPDHDVTVDWEWLYTVGDDEHRVPLTARTSGDEFRDDARERALLAELDIDWSRYGLGTEGPESMLLCGLDTMRFTTEVLPLLDGNTDVSIDVSGDRADYREAGDSLAIGVSTAASSGSTDWFDLGVTLTVEGRDVPFDQVFSALSAGKSELLLPDGAYFSLDKPELHTLRKLIDEARALHDRADGSLRISRFQASLWEEFASLGTVERQAKAWRQQVDGLLAPGTVHEVDVPGTLDAQLRPYQLEGFRWLAFLWEHGLGGILADDMGLGKTLQALAMICHARQSNPAAPPFLIVAPTSVVSNWESESARFAPDANVVAIADTLKRRKVPMDELVHGADIVVTSYTLFRLEFEAYAGCTWSGLILDEAQFTKNHKSKIYQCARRLEAPFKLAITGTPMENNLMELWALLSITAPGLFPNPARFTDYYRKPIEQQGDAELLAQLRRRVKPLMLRRTKKQVVKDLPAKQEQVLDVDLHAKHRKIYDTHLQRERQKILGLLADVDKNRFTILQSLTLLRQLSLDAGLVDDEYRDVPSAKVDALLEQLADVVAGGHRALVFSQFTGFLGKVRDRLDDAGIAHAYLDGGTRRRGDVLRDFKEGDAPVFLISLKAGGFGLNLTEADYCFILDPWWNPATEAQAVDRAHRIGQTRNVMVYRLIAKDTIEDKVMALKAKKSALFASVMDADTLLSSTLDADDIRSLFE